MTVPSPAVFRSSRKFLFLIDAPFPAFGTPVCHAPQRDSFLYKLSKLASGTPDANTWLSMIRANCRERFTAADFDFVVRTLARSRIDHVSLIELLGDAETRDSVLDNPRLVDAILSNAGHLCIFDPYPAADDWRRPEKQPVLRRLIPHAGLG